MTDETNTAPGRAGNPIAGGVLIATAIASMALLANHPGGGAHDFAGLLKDEAANQAMNAVVHGGFVVVLAVQLTCYAVFAARLKRTAGIAGLVFFAMGTAFLCASLVTDGLVIPALAAKYQSVPAKLDSARTLFVLCETFIGFAMPMGLAFQSAAVAAWGWALLRGGAARVAGVFGVALGGLLVAALGLQAANPLALMGALAATALWALVAGVLMLRRTV